jgi:Raf kinase inhibitor-like YbhB/YbcL family protein
MNPMTFKISTPAFDANGEIPVRYTCEGENISPPLRWSGAPEGTKSYVLMLTDPDAPDPSTPRMTWIHWIVYNIPANATGLPEGACRETMPAGCHEAHSDWMRPGYGGPCPPVGRHRYIFTLLALDTTLPELHRADLKAVQRAMKGHVIATAELIGTYKKHGGRRSAGVAA